MESYIGDNVDSLKGSTKASFIRATEWEDFSLSNCSRELAADYIEYLITLCFEMGVPLKDSPVDAFDDVDRYLYLCLTKKVCAVCGRPGEEHHCTGSRIGMGRDRNRVSNEGEKIISLCRGHHTEIHTMPEEEFFQKYHVRGVVYKS